MVLLPSGAVWADSRGSAAPAVVATPSSAVHAGGGEGGRTGFCRFKWEGRAGLAVTSTFGSLTVADEQNKNRALTTECNKLIDLGM
jgi:hypothetical protein